LARWARYDLPRIFSRMAPSTTRSRKAIAKGGSPRYSLQASNGDEQQKGGQCGAQVRRRKGATVA
jgi:hypothetical protein